MVELPEIERAFAYSPKPGDVLIFQLGGYVKAEGVERIARHLRETFGPDIKILLLDKGIAYVPVVPVEAQ